MKKKGLLETLKPGEMKKIDLEIEVVTGIEEIQKIERKIKALKEQK